MAEGHLLQERQRHRRPPGRGQAPDRRDARGGVRKLFKKADQEPKILIVTDKLLTGYDAPVLYAMYLDKPMRNRGLLRIIRFGNV
ncbi:type I restriction enzyme subunit R domain-containing protein [Actinokineospora sp. NPDC004072]